MDFPTIALLTDFGERDGFVGIMKGIMLSRLDLPVPIVDISHQVEPQNIRQASWILQSALPYFPGNTIFVCIVDPDVGSQEQASLLCYWPQRKQIFIAPDNSLLTPVFEAAGTELQVFDIRASELYKTDQLSLHGRSQTFHGRDVYAPLAALCANAMQNNTLAAFLSTLGEPFAPFQRSLQQKPSHTQLGNIATYTGEIAYCDTFGNLITNIPHTWIPFGKILQVQIGQHSPFECPFLPAYADVLKENAESYILHRSNSPLLIAVPSSGGTVEFAVFQGDARRVLQANSGEPVQVTVLL